MREAQGKDFMKLSKIIPERRKTIEFNWCKKDWMEMNQTFRNVRSSHRNKHDRCWWCGGKFVDGEMMSLAQQKKGKNVSLCGGCADCIINT